MITETSTAREYEQYKREIRRIVREAIKLHYRPKLVYLDSQWEAAITLAAVSQQAATRETTAIDFRHTKTHARLVIHLIHEETATCLADHVFTTTSEPGDAMRDAERLMSTLATIDRLPVKIPVKDATRTTGVSPAGSAPT